jgi:hypothetical protein
MIFADDDVDPEPPAAKGDPASKSAAPDDDQGPKPTSPADIRRARFKVVK